MGRVKSLHPYLTDDGTALMRVSTISKFSIWVNYGCWWNLIQRLQKKLFHSNVGIGSWFSQLIQASKDFTIEGRIVWVEIEDAKLLSLEKTVHKDEGCRSDVDEVSEVFLRSDRRIYNKSEELLLKVKTNRKTQSQYPPGYTPKDGIETFCNNGENSKKECGEFLQGGHEEGVNDVFKDIGSNKGSKDDVRESVGSIRSHFYLVHDPNSKRTSWVKWKNVLASKEKGGLGVSSLYALNRGLMFKWVWRFFTQNTSLWSRVIKAIHGEDGKVGKQVKSISRRGGIEQEQYEALLVQVQDVNLVPVSDRWKWSLENSGDFSIASVRKMLDDKMLPDVSIKVTVDLTCMDIASITCSVCGIEWSRIAFLFFKVFMLEILSKDYTMVGYYLLEADLH
ncbi:hypothetical protein Tco_0573829 [Tanacetum coccineum]